MGSHIGLELPFGPQSYLVKVTQDFGRGVLDPADYDHGKISSTFTADRFLYYAVDFGLTSGTPVLGQGYGTVVASRMTAPNGGLTSDGIGNYITVKYDDGQGDVFYATYMHLDKSAVPSSVFPGRPFAYSGSTGGGSAHLHVTYGAGFVNYNGSIGMADGAILSYAPSYMTGNAVSPGNPHGSPVFFTNPSATNGFLLLNSYVRGDNINPGQELPAVVETVNQRAGLNQWSEMNGWFYASDPNPGDVISYWLVYDGNSSAISGHFWAPGGWILKGNAWVPWAGGQVPAGTTVLLNSREMNAASFVGGNTPGVQDTLYVSAYDGHQYSAWKSFVVTTQSGTISGASLPILNHQGISGHVATSAPPIGPPAKPPHIGNTIHFVPHLGFGHDHFLIPNSSGALELGDLLVGSPTLAQVGSSRPGWTFQATDDSGHDQFLAAAAGVADMGVADHLHVTELAHLEASWM